MRVIETETDHLNQTHAFKALDTRLSVVPPQAVPFLDANGVTWYLRIRSEDGALEFVSSLEFPWVSVGTARRYVIRQTPTGSTLYVNPSTSGAILLSVSPPGGTGDALAVELIDRTFRSWDINVVDAPAFTFALVTRERNLGVKLITVP